MEKEIKLKRLVSDLYGSGNGNRIRQLVKNISKSYEKNPEKLKRYFNNENPKIVGLVTSAYHFLTGDIKPIQSREYGGLGAVINDSESNLKFSRCQLHFTKLSGTALDHSKNSGDSLWFSKNSGAALHGSENSGNALWFSENSDYTLSFSKNSDRALEKSVNSGWVLDGSENSDNALYESKNSEKVKEHLGKLKVA